MGRRQTVIGVCALGVLVAFSGCGYQQKPAPAPPDTRAADERAIRAQALEWSQAATARDLEKTLSFYADDASAYPPNAPIAAGKEPRRKLWTDSFAIPGFALSIVTTKVEVARGGDLAYETGTFQLTANDKKGKPVVTPGKYVVVWEKQAGGSWKAVADIWNTDR